MSEDKTSVVQCNINLFSSQIFHVCLVINQIDGYFMSTIYVFEREIFSSSFVFSFSRLVFFSSSLSYSIINGNRLTCSTHQNSSKNSLKQNSWLSCSTFYHHAHLTCTPIKGRSDFPSEREKSMNFRLLFFFFSSITKFLFISSQTIVYYLNCYFLFFLSILQCTLHHPPRLHQYSQTISPTVCLSISSTLFCFMYLKSIIIL